MIFAAATDENTLFVFPSMAAAIAHCEAIDVEDGGWRFWNGSGSALVAEFTAPVHRAGLMAGGGSYRLVTATDKPTLAASLGDIDHLDANPRFATLSDVGDHLAAVGVAPRRED
ncbi:hypothetical protein IB225_08255 [Pseudoxanthomonas sp. PXM02]|nr:hypothetical protein [Pseudoxanthomonas sp. PXM02]